MTFHNWPPNEASQAAHLARKCRACGMDYETALTQGRHVCRGASPGDEIANEIARAYDDEMTRAREKIARQDAILRKAKSILQSAILGRATGTMISGVLDQIEQEQNK